MKLTKPQWKEQFKVYNPHDLARLGGEPPVYVDYHGAETGRAYRSAKWVVIHIREKTDPSGHWMDNGSKVFNVYRKEEKEQQLKAALEFGKKYGVVEWERSPFGSFHPKGTMECAAQTPASVTKESK